MKSKRSVRITTLKQALKRVLSDDQLSRLKTAFDIVGDIAIMELDEEFINKKKEIGEALLSLHKNINVVCMKSGIHEGEFRIQHYDVIAGENRTETVHKENNSRIKLDINKTYFSPRLATERKIISEKVKDHEEVLVMFSGVAPYPVVIARNSDPKVVYGIEKNPDAHLYALENVKLNKLSNVVVKCGDVVDIIPKLDKKFDRIIMPLPKNAEDFLDIAISAAKDNAIIHFYDFLHVNEFEKADEKISKACSSAGRGFEIIERRKVGQQSPRVFRICVDFKLKP